MYKTDWQMPPPVKKGTLQMYQQDHAGHNGLSSEHAISSITRARTLVEARISVPRQHSNTPTSVLDQLQAGHQPRKRKTAMASETLEGFVKKLRTMSGIGLVGLSRSGVRFVSQLAAAWCISRPPTSDLQSVSFHLLQKAMAMLRRTNSLIENVDSSRMT
ncbi:hypothetical protein RJ035_006422 [Blastomyces gilchristii]